MGAPEQFHPLQDAAAVVSRALLAGLAPLPALDVAAWADAHRYLPSKGAAEPGRWRTDRVPYLRPVMDWLSGTHPATRVVLMAAAQTGKTECGLNWVGAFIGTQRGPMLCVQPTLDMAERWSKQRLAPMIDEAPQLRARVAPARSRDSGNTVLLKEFPGGLVIAAGANSATGLRSMPARYVFLDEVDAYPPELDGEGDPVSLAEARTATFGRRRTEAVPRRRAARTSAVRMAEGRAPAAGAPGPGTTTRRPWSTTGGRSRRPPLGRRRSSSRRPPGR